jgi:hypothetical protein
MKDIPRDTVNSHMEEMSRAEHVGMDPHALSGSLQILPNGQQSGNSKSSAFGFL